MKRRFSTVHFCVWLLLASLLWRVVGAPLNAEDFSGFKTQLWQAGILLPQRISRMMIQWQQQEEAQEHSDGKIGTVHVYVEEEGRLVQMTMQEYVCGVVAEEMPAAYHLEALQAQAVAARTRAVAQIEGEGCSAHPGADICTNSAHCQGYATNEECQEKWGEDHSIYRERIAAAEAATANEILVYHGNAIQVFYHAISGGRTEDAQTVFSENLPYLTSVESPGEERVSGFRSETLLSFSEVAQKLSDVLGFAITPDDVRQRLCISSYTETGRVKAMEVNGVQMDAVIFRQALGLRSTWFSITSNEDGILFHQQGYGHGVGMSQSGANAMASNGASYSEILLHYYSGVSIQKE